MEDGEPDGQDGECGLGWIEYLVTAVCVALLVGGYVVFGWYVVAAVVMVYLALILLTAGAMWWKHGVPFVTGVADMGSFILGNFMDSFSPSPASEVIRSIRHRAGNPPEDETQDGK
jgi:uncharacterized membrane protein